MRQRAEGSAVSGSENQNGAEDRRDCLITGETHSGGVQDDAAEYERQAKPTKEILVPLAASPDRGAPRLVESQKGTCAQLPCPGEGKIEIKFRMSKFHSDGEQKGSDAEGCEDCE